MLNKPALTIDLIAPESNMHAMLDKAVETLQEAGQYEEAEELRVSFLAALKKRSYKYSDMRYMIGEYCDVTWLHANIAYD